MSRADILKKINKALSPNKVDFSGIDSEINALKKKLEETVNIQTVDDVKSELEKFKKKIDFTPLTEEIINIGNIFTQKSKDLQSQIDAKTNELNLAKKMIDDNGTSYDDKTKILEIEIGALKNSLTETEVSHESQIASINQSITEVQAIEGKVNDAIAKLVESINTLSSKEEVKKVIKDTQDKLDALRQDILNRINNLGGGAMNRQMFVGGNDPNKRYTDINFKAGSNVTLTFADNNTTKKAEITISSSGGGGGSTRSINSISINTNAGSTSGTDYVYLCSGTLTLTMPDATASNTNLYTVKNVGAGVVTIATTSAQTIDGSSTIVMPVQYTAVDLISDTANWNVT